MRSRARGNYSVMRFCRIGLFFPTMTSRAAYEHTRTHIRRPDERITTTGNAYERALVSVCACVFG